MMNIRELHITDYSEYLRLINIFRETFFTEEQFIEMLKIMKIMKTNSIIIVLELENRLIGTGTILFENKFIHNISKIAHIEDICIDTEFRGKGYGTLLVNHLIEYSKKNGCYKVTLYCKEHLEKFYNSSGLIKNGIQMAVYL
jgi:glucosamine-phosphate N-acetyltransferase